MTGFIIPPGDQIIIFKECTFWFSEPGSFVRYDGCKAVLDEYNIGTQGADGPSHCVWLITGTYRDDA